MRLRGHTRKKARARQAVMACLALLRCMIPLNRVSIKSVKFKRICFRVIVKCVVHAQIIVNGKADGRGRVMPQKAHINVAINAILQGF